MLLLHAFELACVCACQLMTILGISHGQSVVAVCTMSVNWHFDQSSRSRKNTTAILYGLST